MKQEYVYTTPDNLKQNLIIKPYKYTTTPTFSITEISDDEIKNIIMRSTNADENTDYRPSAFKYDLYNLLESDSPISDITDEVFNEIYYSMNSTIDIHYIKENVEVFHGRFTKWNGNNYKNIDYLYVANAGISNNGQFRINIYKLYDKYYLRAVSSPSDTMMFPGNTYDIEISWIIYEHI